MWKTNKLEEEKITGEEGREYEETETINGWRKYCRRSRECGKTIKSMRKRNLLMRQDKEKISETRIFNYRRKKMQVEKENRKL